MVHKTFNQTFVEPKNWNESTRIHAKHSLENGAASPDRDLSSPPGPSVRGWRRIRDMQLCLSGERKVQYEFLSRGVFLVFEQLFGSFLSRELI